MSYNESLNSRSNYPRMSNSEWERAPWNEEACIEVEFDIELRGSVKGTILISKDEYRRATCGVPIFSEGIVEPAERSIIDDALEEQIMKKLREKSGLDDLEIVSWEEL